MNQGALRSISLSMLISISIFLATGLFGNYNQTPRVILTIALMITIYSLAERVSSTRMHWVEILSQLYIAFILITPGLAQCAFGEFPFFRMQYPEFEITMASIAVLVFCIAMNVGTLIPKISHKSDGKSYKFNEFSMQAACIIMAALAMLVASYIGLDNFIRIRKLGMTVTFNPISLSQIQLARSLSFVSLVISIYLLILKKNSTISVICLIACVAVFGVINYPPALPRFILLGYLISIFIIFFKGSIRFKQTAVSISYPAALLTILPFIDYLARGETRQKFSSSIEKYIVSSGDFDSFQSVINVYIWISNDGPKMGYQLLSTLLFFVPRDIWSQKAMPTGAASAIANGYSFTNISAPLPAEFFSDFSWPGLIIGGLLTGMFIGYIDQKSNDSIKSGRVTPLITAAVLAGFSAIIFRGSLMAVIGPTLLVVITARAAGLTQRSVR